MTLVLSLAWLIAECCGNSNSNAVGAVLDDADAQVDNSKIVAQNDSMIDDKQDTNKIVLEYLYPENLKLVTGKGSSLIYKEPSKNSPHLMVHNEGEGGNVYYWSNEMRFGESNDEIPEFNQYYYSPVLGTTEDYYMITSTENDYIKTIDGDYFGYVPMSKSIIVQPLPIVKKDIADEIFFKYDRFKNVFIDTDLFEGYYLVYNFGILDGNIAIVTSFNNSLIYYDEDIDGIKIEYDQVYFGKKYAKKVQYDCNSDYYLDVSKLKEKEAETLVRYFAEHEQINYQIIVKVSNKLDGLEYITLSKNQMKKIGVKKTIRL